MLQPLKSKLSRSVFAEICFLVVFVVIFKSLLPKVSRVVPGVMPFVAKRRKINQFDAFNIEYCGLSFALLLAL